MIRRSHPTLTDFLTPLYTSLQSHVIVDWRLVGWLYGGKYYPGTAAFLAAFNSSSFKTYTRNEGVDGSWAMTDKKGADLPLDSRAPPMQILPEGKRWKVDADAKFVVYQDFSFFIGFTRDTGVRLFDIKYKGERIIYELGLQEALAHCELEFSLFLC